jgi:hypothetical protein
MRALIHNLSNGVALASLLIVPALARERPATKPKPVAACRLTYADELKSVRAISAKTGWALYPIEGNDVAKFLAIFNSAEPRTDFKADRILVSVNPQFAYVELFVGGCVDNDGKISPATFDAMMGEAFGDEIPNGTAI